MAEPPLRKKDQSKQLIEKHKEGNGYQKISKSQSIPWSTVKPIIKKRKKL